MKGKKGKGEQAGHPAEMQGGRDPFQRLLGLMFKAHPWHGVSIGEEAPDVVTAYIEIVPTDTVKYEVDKSSGFLTCNDLRKRAHQVLVNEGVTRFLIDQHYQVKLRLRRQRFLVSQLLSFS